MIITSIVSWKKDRYLVYLNDEPGFALYKSDIKQFKLKEGDELSDPLYERIKDEVLIKRAKSRTLHILDRRDKTEKELRDKLSESMYPGEVIDEAVEAAKRGNYLDDMRYACQYIYEKSATKSLKMIEADLISKGIDKGTLSEALSRSREELEEGDIDRESALIMKLIKKRCPEPKELDLPSEQKLLRYLTGKGFEYGKCRKILNAFREDEGGQ